MENVSNKNDRYLRLIRDLFKETKNQKPAGTTAAIDENQDLSSTPLSRRPINVAANRRKFFSEVCVGDRVAVTATSDVNEHKPEPETITRDGCTEYADWVILGLPKPQESGDIDCKVDYTGLAENVEIVGYKHKKHKGLFHEGSSLIATVSDVAINTRTMRGKGCSLVIDVSEYDGTKPAADELFVKWSLANDEAESGRLTPKPRPASITVKTTRTRKRSATRAVAKDHAIESHHPSVVQGDEKLILVDTSSLLRSKNFGVGLDGYSALMNSLKANGFKPFALIDAATPYILDDAGKAFVDKLVASGDGQLSPGGTRADDYMLALADKMGVDIISFDRFRDYAKTYPWTQEQDDKRRVHAPMVARDHDRLVSLIPSLGICG